MCVAALFRWGCAGICLALLAAPSSAAAQDTAAWTRFDVLKKGEYTYGYNDAKGQIKIPAKFGGFTNANRFRHIMAVSEADTYQQYYLLKNGRQVGRDSVFMFDFSYDCESEGAILFRDAKKNRVGFLNTQGKVFIPAIYNHATPFHNGVAMALIGAKRTCWGGGDTLSCEHSGWTGGRRRLINQRNEVLADLATATTNSFRLNWYSLQRNAPAPDTATTVTLTGAGGERYTFTEYDREFKQWFFGTFVPALRTSNAETVKPLCFSDLAVSSRPFRGWPHYSRAAFVAKYQPALRAKLGGLRRGAPGVDFGAGDLNTLIFTSPVFQQFLTDCGQHFEEKYPVFEVLLTYPARPANAPIDHQEHFEFIRTASGYQLFSVSL
ncbi:MAG: WG repeat-containing protein [Janthinobacterium lividum]